jgi:hypothetical protein
MPIAEYAFKGPYPTLKKVENERGVFAILSQLVDKYYLLDVGCSEDVKKAIQGHNRRKCWERYRKGKIRYAVFYTNDFPEKANMEIENEIRQKYKTIPCGKIQELIETKII